MKSADLLSILVFGTVLWATGSAFAQAVDLRAVPLVRQDFSDCSNANVSAQDPSFVGGTASIERRPNTTFVRVSLGGQPNTTYHFFLKCVRLIGDLTTDTDGFGTAVFQFGTNEAGDIYAFDSYPEGAPLGNKYQSVQVNFRIPAPPVVPSPRIDYVNQTGDDVNFEYEDMPAGTEVVVVNVASGDPVAGLNYSLSQGGSGSGDITIPRGGAYYLRAQGQSDKQYIAQTIKFYGY